MRGERRIGAVQTFDANLAPRQPGPHEDNISFFADVSVFALYGEPDLNRHFYTKIH